ncbi:hypothetical protein D3C87_1575570 [compost metagenome]
MNCSHLGQVATGSYTAGLWWVIINVRLGANSRPVFRSMTPLAVPNSIGSAFSSCSLAAIIGLASSNMFWMLALLRLRLP